MQGYLDECMRIVLPNKTGEERERYIAYIEGMIDGYERFGKPEDGEIVAAWREFSYSVASKGQIAPYFRMRSIIDGTEGALTSYELDFYKHDFHCVRAHPDSPFIWGLRDWGTHWHLCTTKDVYEVIDAWYSTYGNKFLFVGVYDPASMEFIKAGDKEHLKSLVGNYRAVEV